jgi:ABC-type transporter Mla subunit MlaD
MHARLVRSFRSGSSILLVLAATLAGCGPPPFTFTVTFPGEASLEPGAVIRYQGVDVGEVTAVALRQSDPERAARVEVICAIEAPEITIRRDDLIEIASDGLLGEDYLRITPIPESSPAIEPGSVVAGIPPFVTRVRESAEATLDSLESFAKEQAGSLLDALSGDSEPPPAPPAPTLPTP